MPDAEHLHFFSAASFPITFSKLHHPFYRTNPVRYMPQNNRFTPLSVQKLDPGQGYGQCNCYDVENIGMNGCAF
jgi:hypothetical protein